MSRRSVPRGSHRLISGFLGLALSLGGVTRAGAQEGEAPSESKGDVPEGSTEEELAAPSSDAPPPEAAAQEEAKLPLEAEASAAPSQEAEESSSSASAEPKKEQSAGAAAESGQAGAWLFKHFFDHIKVRGYTQLRFNQPTTNSRLVNLQGDRSVGGEGGFLIRRARIVLQGEIHPLVSIYLQPDFASTTADGLHYVQMRDWYFDIAEPSKEFRIRVGQSKVPFGFENLQSSQNRLPLDRSDAINSAMSNERDLGIFLYYAPTEIRARFKHLVESGLKGSGDYGVVGVGLFNGQTANKADLNENKHVVARVSYPFDLGGQFLEVGGGGYVGRYVIKKEENVSGEDEFWDARGNLAFTLYPQPFGLQAEYNVGVGPELTNISQTTDASGSAVFRGEVREGFLHGGYVLASLKLDDLVPGTLIPYVRGVFYEGGKKHETNAPRYSIRELEAGLEWQPFGALELVAAYATAERTFSKFPYNQESGHMARFQLQVNY